MLKERTCTKCDETFLETANHFKFSKYKRCFSSLCIPCDKKYHAEKSLIFYNNHKNKYLEYGRAKRKVERLTAEGIFNTYRYRAKGKNLSFALSLEQFSSFWQKSCFYCDDLIPTICLDRVDSSKGYTLDNVVPSCIECNRMKLATSQVDFIERCRKIAKKFER